jgi:hypothetical protein
VDLLVQHHLVASNNQRSIHPPLVSANTTPCDRKSTVIINVRHHNINSSETRIKTHTCHRLCWYYNYWASISYQCRWSAYRLELFKFSRVRTSMRQSEIDEFMLTRSAPLLIADGREVPAALLPTESLSDNRARVEGYDESNECQGDISSLKNVNKRHC